MHLDFPTTKFIREFTFSDSETNHYLRERILATVGSSTDVYGLGYNLIAGVSDQWADIDHKDPRYSAFFDFMHTSVTEWVQGVLGGATPFQYHYQALWAVDYAQGSWARPHRHGAGCLSFVYYVDGDGEHSPLVFDDLALSVAAAQGQLVLFPGWLSHSVSEFWGKERRLLAGNIVIV